MPYAPLSCRVDSIDEKKGKYTVHFELYTVDVRWSGSRLEDVGHRTRRDTILALS